MTAEEIREKYLKFFESKGHKRLPSASLIPENDPTVLFTTAGMHPLVPYLLGEKHPEGSRLCNVQKCVRTNDIDEVGDAWHLTFFEMLGNWSLGDYFKEEAIAMAWEFLTGKKWLGIKPERLSVTVFKGDRDAPEDTEAADIWRKAGIAEKRIYYYPKSENWWGPAGETGPCGPDTEIFFDTGQEKCGPKCEPRCKCGKYAEIWNLVFMQYNKKADGTSEILTQEVFEPLKQKNVDTGMGLERTVAVLNGYNNVYEIDSFVPIVNKIKELLPHDGDNLSAEQVKSMRIIADHLRAATFILAEGVEPSNLGRGYVLRRLIRRAVLNGFLLGIEKKFTSKIALTVIDIYQKAYPELSKNQEPILKKLEKEEEKFKKTLEVGIKELHKIYFYKVKESAGRITPEEKITKSPEEIAKEIGEKLFFVYQTYGFPLELSLEEIKNYFGEELIYKDEIKKSFQEELKKHQELSRKASAGMFKGGLSDASEMTTKYHTATHLLHAALREVLGKHVEQRGSNITPERLRFDFSHPGMMTDEQIQKVEAVVNQKSRQKLPVICEEMSPEEAKHQGAIGLFGHKYGDKVKVYSINSFSKEICGGPHAQNTDELGHFKILKEESSGAGVRRIKAILE
ncbi:MAG: alanine--tRNA ligase [Candidatus Doudnabacteria bacterium]